MKLDNILPDCFEITALNGTAVLVVCIGVLMPVFVIKMPVWKTYFRYYKGQPVII